MLVFSPLRCSAEFLAFSAMLAILTRILGMSLLCAQFILFCLCAWGADKLDPSESPNVLCVQALQRSRALGYRARHVMPRHNALTPLHELNPELAFWLAHRDGFEDLMKQRFSSRKATHPKDPWNFEFFDFAQDHLNFMRSGLLDRLSELKAEMNDWIEHGLQEHGMATILARQTLRIQFVAEVLAEIEGALNRQSIGYKDYYYLGEYFGRALSSTVDAALDWRFWKEWGLGVVFNGLEEEYAQYRRRYLPFNAKFGLTEHELFGPEFKYIILLQPQPISWEVLFRTQSENVTIAGISTNIFPGVPGDGYWRHPALWHGHDVYHFAVIRQGVERYKKQHQLGPRGWELVKKRMRFWQDQLVKAIYSIEDLELQTAVTWFAFRYHRDNGNPTAPSVVAGGVSLWDIIKDHYFLALSHQQYGLGSNVIRKHRLARKWLIAFWSQFADEEKELLEQARMLDR